MPPITNWLRGQISQERRRAQRHTLPGLVAYYWEGGAPVAHGVRDISSTGLYLTTEQRWYPGTVLIMTLQKKGVPEDGSERSIAVQSKVIRLGEDGAGLAFVSLSPSQGQGGESNVADRKTLDRFLERLWAKQPDGSGREPR